MEKVQERTSKYEISIKLKKNSYYIARISFRMGGGKSSRFEKSGTTEEKALLSLLNLLIETIDISFKSNLITCKFDDRIQQSLISSINNTGITSPEIMEKALLIINKINAINAYITHNIYLQNSVIPFLASTSNVTANNSSMIPTSPNIIAPTTPTIDSSNKMVETQKELVIIEDLAESWHKYRLSLCIKTDDNPKPLSQKTIDNNFNRLNDDILPYFKKHKILYLSQITTDVVEALLKFIKCQNSKHKIYIILNMLFKYAIKQHKATSNPLEYIKKPSEKIKTCQDEDNNYIEPDRQDIWLDKFEEENTDMSKLFETMFLTGLRPEEACGLKWTSLDFENDELIVNNAYKNFIKYDENGKK